MSIMAPCTKLIAVTANSQTPRHVSPQLRIRHRLLYPKPMA
jgi:hypothetical protein